MYRLCLLFLLIFTGTMVYAQSTTRQIDSLLQLITQDKKDSLYVCACNDLSFLLDGQDAIKGLAYAQKAINAATGLKSQYLLAQSMNMKGIAYDYLGKSDSALTLYQQSLDIKRKIRDSSGIAATYMNIGVMYYYLDDHTNSLKYYEMALALYKLLHNENKVAGILTNMGAIYRARKNYTGALTAYKEAYQLKERNHDTLGMSNALSNMAIVYQHQGDYSKSEELQKQSVQLDSLTKNDFNLVASYVSLAELYFYMKKIRQSTVVLEKAIALGKKLDAIHYLDDAYMLYMGIDTVQKDYRAAFFHQQEFNRYRDLIHQSEKKGQLDRLEIIYRTKEKEKEIELLNAEKQIDDLKISEQKSQLTIIVIVLAVLALALFFGIFAYRSIRNSRNHLNKKNKIIEQALYENEALLREVHHRVKNNLQVISSLLSIQSRYMNDKEGVAAIMEGRNRVRSMALIHEELYQNKDLKKINVKEYMVRLSTSLFDSYNVHKNSTIVPEIEDVQLDIDMLVPLGLILNELCTNSIKYAFSDYKAGKLYVMLRQENDYIYLSVSDNGPGFAGTNEQGNMGFQLIRIFADKLKAEVKMENRNGAFTEIKIPLKKT